MRDAAGQLPHSIHFLRLTQPCFGGFARCHFAHQTFVRGAEFGGAFGDCVLKFGAAFLLTATALRGAQADEREQRRACDQGDADDRHGRRQRV